MPQSGVPPSVPQPAGPTPAGPASAPRTKESRFKRIEDRVRTQLDEVRQRDAAHHQRDTRNGVVVAAVGALFGALMVGVVCLQGSLSWIAGLLIPLVSTGAFLLCHLRRWEIVRSMLAYPALLLATVLLLWSSGQLRCDELSFFALILLIFVGMAVSYAFGWVRSQ